VSVSVDSLYTPEIRDMFRSMNWPAGTPLRVIDKGDHVMLSVKRGDFQSLDHRTQVIITDKINTFMWSARNKGCPIFLEAV